MHVAPNAIALSTSVPLRTPESSRIGTLAPCGSDRTACARDVFVQKSGVRHDIERGTMQLVGRPKELEPGSVQER